MHTTQVEFILSAVAREHFPKLDLPEIAFAGRSNVGKSSLINTLIGKKQVARVSSTPGRTQSINFFQVNTHWVFVDLPGYGYAKVPPAMKKAWQKLLNDYLVDRTPLQGVVLIVDVRRDPMASDIQLKEFLEAHGVPLMVVATKVDKLSKQNVTKQIAAIARGMGIARESILPFSSVTRAGRQELWEAIRELMIEGTRRMKEVRIAWEQQNRAKKIGRDDDAGPIIIVSEDGPVENTDVDDDYGELPPGSLS